MSWPDNVYEVCGIESHIQTHARKIKCALEIFSLFSEDEQRYLFAFYRAGYSKAEITKKYGVSMHYICNLLTGQLNEIVYSNIEYFNLLKIGEKKQSRSEVPNLTDSALLLFPDIHTGRCIQRAQCKTIKDVAVAYYTDVLRRQRGVGPLVLSAVKARLQLYADDLASIQLFNLDEGMIRRCKAYSLQFAFKVANDGQPPAYYEKSFCNRCGKHGISTIGDLNKLSVIDGELTAGHTLEISSKINTFFTKTQNEAKNLSVISVFTSKYLVKALINHNVVTLNDLQKAFTDKSLDTFDEVGRRSYKEIERVLKEYKLI